MSAKCNWKGTVKTLLSYLLCSVHAVLIITWIVHHLFLDCTIKKWRLSNATSFQRSLTRFDFFALWVARLFQRENLGQNHWNFLEYWRNAGVPIIEPFSRCLIFFSYSKVARSFSGLGFAHQKQARISSQSQRLFQLLDKPSRFDYDPHAQRQRNVPIYFYPTTQAATNFYAKLTRTKNRRSNISTSEDTFR